MKSPLFPEEKGAICVGAMRGRLCLRRRGGMLVRAVGGGAGGMLVRAVGGDVRTNRRRDMRHRTNAVGAVCDRPHRAAADEWASDHRSPLRDWMVSPSCSGAGEVGARSSCGGLIRLAATRRATFPKGEGTGAHASILTIFKQYSPHGAYAHQNLSLCYK